MLKRTKTQWLELIEQHKLSGLSATEFCRQNRLDRKYFSLRKRELGVVNSSFVKVQAEGSKAESNGLINVRLVGLSVSLNQLPMALSALIKG